MKATRHQWVKQTASRTVPSPGKTSLCIHVTNTDSVHAGCEDTPARIGRRHCPRRAFTLLETSLAIIIVGVGVLAIMAAQQTFHRQNAWSTHTSTATWLGNEIREMTLRLPRHDPVLGTAFWGPEPDETSIHDYNDLDDFAGPEGTGTLFTWSDGSGPVNSRREVLPNMTGWSQHVRVFHVDPFDLSKELGPFESDMMMVEVTVTYQGPQDEEPWEVTRVSWIAPN